MSPETTIGDIVDLMSIKYNMTEIRCNKLKVLLDFLIIAYYHHYDDSISYSKFPSETYYNFIRNIMIKNKVNSSNDEVDQKINTMILSIINSPFCKDLMQHNKPFYLTTEMDDDEINKEIDQLALNIKTIIEGILLLK